MNIRVLFLIVTALLVQAVGIQQAQETIEDEPPPGLTIHVVQRGENLFRIALRYGLTTQQLAELNGIINVGQLQVGQRLLVPAGDFEIVLEAPTHVVRAGETLSSIARFYGLDVEQLMTINEITNPNQIYAGQVLQLTAEVTEAAPTSPPPTANAADVVASDPTDPIEVRTGSSIPDFSGNIHIVRRGETLFRIATSYGLTTSELAAANGITDPTRIFAGQQLVIPGQPELEAALDLPEPLRDLRIRPQIFTEGETASIVVQTAVPAALTGTFLDRELPVISQEDDTLHVMLIGIPIFTEAGINPVQLQIQANDGTRTDYTFNVRVAEGPYGAQNLNLASQQRELLAPAVEENEINLLRDLTTRVTPQRYFDGPLSLPAAAAMNSPFGTRRSYNGGPLDRYHTGADFASAPGTPIFAAAPGVVVMADRLHIRGNATVIDHGWGVFTTYSHQTEIYVSPGETVATGQVIGTAGSTGRVTGSHLHWEVWVNGVPVNPLQWTHQTFP